MIEIRIPARPGVVSIRGAAGRARMYQVRDGTVRVSAARAWAGSFEVIVAKFNSWPKLNLIHDVRSHANSTECTISSCIEVARQDPDRSVSSRFHKRGYFVS
jgi:hypothetical protein